ncbi:hypothetical protein G6O67_006574 [Ophiocordyceps sinensis]|uniref:Uncharacterized protein n=1 Tax=Ophiocordyceps sinensis TaxID=72228 RepID=A0A8H4LVT6_9HYPO|nr:hypothetical protein G6O67_006574 [Ophiocordyceps sinensis]
MSSKMPVMSLVAKASNISRGTPGLPARGFHEASSFPALTSAILTMSTKKRPPTMCWCQMLVSDVDATDESRTRTADSLANGNELPNRDVATPDATDDGPLAMVLDGSGHHVGEVLHRGERDGVVRAAFCHEHSAIVKVDGSLDGGNVLG